jgi:AcrR family transcriptional regulator
MARTTTSKPTADDAQVHPTDWDRKRRQILDAAAEVFFARGFERGTTKEIAELVGLSQPSIYHYVGNKHVLLAEIARQVAGDFTTALDEALASRSEPPDQLRAIIYGFASTLAVNRKTFAVYWKELNSIPTDAAGPVERSQHEYVSRVDAVVSACQQSGALPAQHPTHVLTEGILGMLSWMHWWYRPDGRSTPDEVAEAFCDLIGLRASAPTT